MDLTKFIIESREKALLYGDYRTYRALLSNRLLKCRKKLSIATKHRGKYHGKPKVTAEQVAENHEYLYLQLMTAERAWAHAMTMKASHEADTKGISAHTRSHIVSRLDKAAKAAEYLASIIADNAEARAYANMLRGSEQFEKQSWEPCLRSYSVARIIYSALSSSSRTDIFKDLLSETIDPSIRYAAYQLKTPRSLPIPAIARRAFPYSDRELVALVNKLDPNTLKQGDQEEKKGLAGAESASRTITWRSREVRIEDAAIATAWAALEVAKGGLADKLSPDMSPKDMATAYDDVLIVSQDAVDATKQAIDELREEGVSQSDSRVQSLYITRTAVNYEMISWRIGRNRVLAGEHDGALPEHGTALKQKASRKPSRGDVLKEEAPGRKIARLKEKVVLYDATLQSLESIKELPGVAADEELSRQLDATSKYFNSLKCLAIARSHALTGNPANALALLSHGYEQCRESVPTLSEMGVETRSPLRNIQISRPDIKFLHDLFQGEVQRYRALVDIENMRKQAGNKPSKSKAAPLWGRLGEYPADSIDLDNIVVYPPQVEPIPVKPLFLDIAWNYIEYPDRQGKGEARGKEKRGAEPEKPQKRGWFGFGR